MNPFKVSLPFWKRLWPSDEVAVVARGAGSSFLMRGLGMGLGYVVHIALAQWLGAAEYGVYTYVLTWTAILAIPAGLGLPLFVVRFVPEYTVKKEWPLLRGLLQWGGTRILSVGVCLTLAGMALVVLLDADVTGVYARPLLIGLWLVPFHALLNATFGTYRGFHRMGSAFAIPVFRHLLVLAVMVVLWGSGVLLSSLHALLATLAAALLVLGLQGGALWRRLPAPVKQAHPTYAPRTWLRVSIPLLLAGGSVMVLNQTDMLMVGTLLGPRDAGLYRAASQTASLASLVPIAVGAAADPMLSRLHAEGNLARLQRLSSVFVRWAAGGSLAVAVLFIIAGGPVLALFGNEFVAAYDVLLILVGGHVFYAGVGLAAGLLNLTGHQKWGMLIFSSSALLNGVLNPVGIVLWGSIGAAVATTTSLAVMSMALWLQAKKNVGIDASILYALRRNQPR